MVFFQDTNALAFYTLAAALGVSKSLDLEVNSMAIPRFPKQAIGAIAKYGALLSIVSSSANIVSTCPHAIRHCGYFGYEMVHVDICTGFSIMMVV